jgi:hypothetical protein
MLRPWYFFYPYFQQHIAWPHCSIMLRGHSILVICQGVSMYGGISGVQHILCCVFVLFVFVLCTLCCQFLWIIRFWLTVQYSLTSIYSKAIIIQQTKPYFLYNVLAIWLASHKKLNGNCHVLVRIIFSTTVLINLLQ